MTKAELVDQIVKNTGLDRDDVSVVVENFMTTVKEEISKDRGVFLRGFGTFQATKRAEKIGRNILKEEPVIIPACRKPTFKPSKAFTEMLKKNR